MRIWKFTGPTVWLSDLPRFEANQLVTIKEGSGISSRLREVQRLRRSVSGDHHVRAKNACQNLRDRTVGPRSRF